MGKILITAKVNPDLDGTACALAYADFKNRLKSESEGVVFGTPQSEVGYFINQHNITIPTREDNGIGDWQSVILVDASSMKGMPKVVLAENVNEIIDHRKSEPEKEFPHAKIQNELIGAAATIVTERFMKAEILPTLDNAKLLYGAIYHNSLNFIATNTNVRDREAAKFLSHKFGLTENIIREMFDYTTMDIARDLKTALENDAKEFGEGNAIGAYQLIVWGSGILNKKDEIEGVVGGLTEKSKVNWSFLNIVDLEEKKSIIYAADSKGQQIISEVIGADFKDGWATVSQAWLRKQIMPKVYEVIEKKSNLSSM